jgi:RNA polymerase sigma-70 factor (ECF subfamily)
MHQLPDTRASLIVRLQGVGEDTAWSEFCGVYEAAVSAYARHKGLGDADASDVTQDVLAAVFEAIGSWNPDGQPASFRRWLFRIAHNAVVSALKRRARGVHATGRTWEWDQLQAAEAPDSSDRTAFDREFRREAFRWAAARVAAAVSEPTWQAFILTALEGRPPHEVAATCGLTVGGVYTARCRVLARLRKEVEAFVRMHGE